MLVPLSLALASVLQASAPLTNADLRLVATAKPRILVGEFVTVRTTWTARHRVAEPDEYGWIEVDRGRGFEAHAEPLEGWVCVFSAPRDLAPGRSLVTEHVVGLEQPAGSPASGLDEINASLALVFDRPGRYRLRLRYDDATSNVVEVEAIAPIGEDARLLATLRSQLLVISALGAMDDTLRARGLALVQAYGRHPLLAPFLRRFDGGDNASSRRVASRLSGR